MPKVYANKWGADPVTTPKKVVGIDGGRAIQARRMRVAFDGDANDVALDCENIAGYIIVAWDDQGAMVSRARIGERNPYSPLDIPDRVRQMAHEDIMHLDEAGN